MSKRLAAMANDVMGLIGLGMLVHGIDMIHRPAGFIAAGLILSGIAFLVARRG